jgi:3-hydroxyisobutyrate dehydrogenase-like beta-hydroxyacid dehydrogenase
MDTVAVLGAGLLGSGFVENLLSKGMSVRVWNRTASKLAPLVERGAVLAASPADAVAGVSRVHLILAEDTAVDAVVDALRPGLAAGVPIFDHSTNLPDKVAARFARLRADGVRYLHCPVFMAPSNARGATGLMLVAGPAADVAEFMPALSTMTGSVWHVGERPELAAIHKLLGNGMLISFSGVMGDTLAIAAAQGLGPDAVSELLAHFNPGANLGGITQRVVRSDTASASFTLEMARKDVRLMLETGGPGLTVLPGVAARMDEAIAEGMGGKDYAAFAKR